MQRQKRDKKKEDNTLVLSCLATLIASIKKVFLEIF